MTTSAAKSRGLLNLRPTSPIGWRLRVTVAVDGLPAATYVRRMEQQSTAASNSTPSQRQALVLGIETSCDETAAAVVARAPDGTGRILSNAVRAQWEEHRRYGGVVPELAARAHLECLDEIVALALRDAGTDFSGLDAVAVTAGPGLIGGLLVGGT